MPLPLRSSLLTAMSLLCSVLLFSVRETSYCSFKREREREYTIAGARARSLNCLRARLSYQLSKAAPECLLVHATSALLPMLGSSGFRV